MQKASVDHEVARYAVHTSCCHHKCMYTDERLLG